MKAQLSNLLSHDTPHTRHGHVIVTNLSMPTAGAVVSGDDDDGSDRMRESASEKRTDSAFGKIGAKIESMAGLQ